MTAKTLNTDVNDANIPAELKGIRHWIIWREEIGDDGKPTKVLYRALEPSRRASSTDSTTWTAFDAAMEVAKRLHLGIGFVATKETGLVFLDFDHCRDPDSGAIDTWAFDAATSLNTYFEVSPSGTGLRGVGKGVKPGMRCKKDNVEMYDDVRFLTFTGDHLEGFPKTIDECTDAITWVYETYLDSGEDEEQASGKLPDANPTGLSDKQVIEKAKAAKNGEKFTRLWEGDTTGYPSESEADLALTSHLWFWTGDADRVYELICQSGLHDKKWERNDYRERTLTKACSGEVYSPTNPLIAERLPKAEPILASDAFYGVAGEVIASIEPHTESDPSALLITFLVMAGNAIGRDAHAVAEAARHGCNLFAVIVADTSKGRKGSSYGQIRELFNRADPMWSGSRIKGGLSSGEGLVWEVRDPIEKQQPIKENGRRTGEYETVIDDQGVEDKRLFIFEPEFSSVLKVATRDGNTLSAVVRQAWDSGELRTLTKNNPAVATDTHISLIGHIVREELLRYMSDTEVSNGGANRILWVYARRRRILPEGGGDVPYHHLVPMVHDALERARNVGRLQRDDDARKVWAAIYEELSDGKPGLFGSVIARAEAQVLRLSVLYAALDGDDAIRPAHLSAALAVWEYCEKSAAFIFGDATGNPIADRILESLRATGELSRTSISALLGRNVKAERIAQALDLLLRLKKAQREIRDSDGGRPSEVWTAL